MSMTIQYHEVIKRDGMRDRFDVIKIVNAIQKAAWACGVELDYELIRTDITSKIERKIMEKPLKVDEIQDIVEEGLMKHYPQVAKSYILYRDMRNRERSKK